MKFASSESSLSLSKVTCPRTRVIFHRKLSQANHVKRIMAARLKDSQEGPYYTLPTHQSNYSRMQEPRNEWNPSTNTNLKFGRQRSQSSNCYSRITRQKEDLESRKCASQTQPNADTSHRNQENTVFNRNKIPSQEQRSKVPIYCGKNRVPPKEQITTTYSNIPICKNRKNMSIVSNNTTPSPREKGFGNFRKQTIYDGNLISNKPISNTTKCSKRMVSLIERLDQVCLLDDMLAGDSKKILESENSNDSFKKYDLKSSFNRNESSPANYNYKIPASAELPIKANLSLLKTSKKTNSSNENNNKKKNVLLKTENETNNIQSFSKSTVDSTDYKTTYSTLSEASTSSSYLFDETKNTFDFEEEDPTSEKDQMQFNSTKMAPTCNSKKLSETTFHGKAKLRQMIIQVPMTSKIPMATLKLKYKGIPNEAIKPVNDLKEQMILDETQDTLPSSRKQISRQNQSKNYNYHSSRIPIRTERLRTTQKNLKPMKNPKTASSKYVTNHKCLTNQSTETNSGDVSCKENADKKVSTWLQNLPESEGKSKIDAILKINASYSNFKGSSQRESKEQTASTSKIPTLSKHSNGKIPAESCLVNRSCSSLPHEPNTKAHVKHRKSVIDSDMLMGKSSASSIKNEFFESPIQKFMDVINSTFSDIESDESI